MELTQLFAQGGFALVSIGVLLFIVKWFMERTREMQEDFMNHTSDYTKQVAEFSEMIKMFEGSISEMAVQLRELNDGIRDIRIALEKITGKMGE